MGAVRIPFGEWLPDLADISTPGMVEAQNVLPAIDGYIPLPALSAKTAALATKALYGAWMKDIAGNIEAFVGTTTKLYKRATASTWEDVSHTAYTATQWDFAPWGEYMVACNGVDVTVWYHTTSSTDFAAVTGAPIAKAVAAVRDFLVFGNTTESSTRYPYRVRWSGFNNAETYGSSLSTQADFQDLPSTGGEVQRVVPGAIGVVFQERAIHTMTYVGPPVIHRFDEVQPSRGTPAAGSVCWHGAQIFFYSNEGFYSYSVSNGLVPIGENKVDAWFLGKADSGRYDEMRGVVDRNRNMVFWSFPSTSAGTNNDTLLIFDINSNRWAWAAVETETICEMLAFGFDLDTIDSLLASGIDTDSFNMDSRAYVGGALLVVGFDSAHKLASFDGTAMTAVLETAESALDDSRFWVQELRPLVTGSPTIVANIGYRNKENENVSYTSDLSPTSTGRIPARKNARFHRFKLTLSDGFDHASGIIVSGTPEGSR